jgi:hypothetical protein
MPKNEISPNRQVAKDFSPTPFTNVLGPSLTKDNSIQNAITESNKNIDYDDWKVLDTFDEGLRQALINWIDTTKEGKVIVNPTGSTRSKTINFQFYGTPSKDIIGSGDIGEYSLIFKYTKKIVSPISTTNVFNNNQRGVDVSNQNFGGF